MRIHNTLTRNTEEFRPLNEGRVALYACGPTVYGYAHIGNLRTYIFEDVLRRIFEYNGYKVVHAMNITDVGHLVSDADEGEDKMEVGAKREGKHPLEIARQYETAFLEDLKKLNILSPMKILRATESIQEQVEIIKILEQKGFAYKGEQAVYFDTSRLKDYGKLSGQKLEDKKTGAREGVVVDARKRNSADFALWFFLVGRYKNHILHWSSPWGEGFPGWHIECSAISKKLLGQPFDIHCGGVDHIGTHHTNEIAQSEAAFGKPLANTWIHGEFLLVDNAKMSKSMNNFYTLKDIQERGVDPLAFRYFVLGAHYRSPLNFTWEALDGAQRALSNLRDAYSEIRNQSKKEWWRFAATKEALATKQKFTDAMNNDLNTPKALAIAWEVVKSKDLSARKKRVLLDTFDHVLGLKLLEYSAQHSHASIPREIKALVERRELCRHNEQFVQADALRKKILELGYEVDDTPQGPSIRKVR